MTAGTGLRVEGLSVRYGGNLAVDDVSLDAPPGRIVGLIGPNGAGKTTTFSGCTGLVRPAAGRVHLGDRDITDLPPQRRAQLGLGRTFQRMELFDSLSVAENIALGREAGYAGSRPLRHLRAPRREVAETRDAVERSLVICGIGHLADRPVLSLSTGQRRLVELARAMAARTQILLLDEPSSGLDHNETEGFGRILVELAAEGTGILLVEHDMSLVMGICDHIYVLDFGQLVFDGTAKQVAASTVVRQAYLGGEIAELSEERA
jgi:ABC-type branched-subunit amino acid transport system ATPase component